MSVETSGGRQIDDERAVQGVYNAGMILRVEVLPHVSGDARRHLEAAVDELDATLQRIRSAALADQDTPDP
jgi:hypothetical protein